MNWSLKLKYRSFGKTDLKVSEIGFGGASIGYTAGFDDDKACIDCVRNAIDVGLNFFDTSPVYGKSEINLGEAIGADRNKIILATKVRLPHFEDSNDMKNFITASVERSLARLKTDYIDLLQIHHQVGNERGVYQFRNDPPEFATRLNYSDCMEFYDCTDLLRSSGKVRYIGFTGWDGDYEAQTKLINSGKFTSIQILYNVLNQSAHGEARRVPHENDQGYGDGESCTINLARQNKVAIIGIRPFANGAIVDKIKSEKKYDKQIYREHQLVQKMKFQLHRDDLSLAQIALLFCLSNKKISTIVPGIKNVSELNEIISIYGSKDLKKSDIDEISAWYHNQ
jgi:aryl-alcohol dehydrogenase-like predicted oxidoreductase